MAYDLRYIFAKVLTILIIILLYYLINQYYSLSKDSKDSKYSVHNYSTNQIETFEDKIEKEKNNYLKLKETNIESEGTSLDLLYVNYSGEEVDKDVWENKTFDQCIDTCNKLDNCIGFNRDAVLDSEPANCYPRTKIQNCYSNRKGNHKQMSNALKYNSYIKSTYPNIINTCIGDTNLTLNRIIVIKSYAMPNQYIGNNGDSRVSMIDKTSNDINKKCNFRIEQGKDGVGTVSFFHINTNQYLYRNNENILIFKDVKSSKTEDKQRSSFNIHDGLSNGIMFKVMPIDGETTDKYVIMDNSYLQISSINNNSEDNVKNMATFYIIDNITESNIITDHNKIPTISKIPTTTTPPTEPTKKSNTSKKSNTQNKTYESFISDTITSIPINNKLQYAPNNNIPNNIETFIDKLDNTNDLLFYNNLFNNSNSNINISNYLQDTYLPSPTNIIVSTNNTFNDRILKNKISKTISQNQDTYDTLTELNYEIEKEIANKNLDLNAKNDKIINNLDKIRIADLAKDYFFYKTISDN